MAKLVGSTMRDKETHIIYCETSRGGRYFLQGRIVLVCIFMLVFFGAIACAESSPSSQSSDNAALPTPAISEAASPKPSENLPPIIKVRLTIEGANVAIFVNGTAYSVPLNLEVPAGNPMDIHVVDPPPQGDTRDIFDRWSDGGRQRHEVRPTSNVNYTAFFKRQYFVKVNSIYGMTSGSNWYDAGAEVNPVVLPATVPETSTVKRIHTGWTERVPLIIKGPTSITAVWEIEYLLEIPHKFNGSIFIDGSAGPPSTRVSAWIDGKQVAETLYDGAGYSLVIAAPLGESFQDKTIIFKVDNLLTIEMARHMPGSTTALNLTAIKAPPPKPTIKLAPEMGIVTLVTGSHFSPLSPVKIRGQLDTSIVELPQAKTDGTGNFSAVVMAPGQPKSGGMIITAVDITGAEASAVFRVLELNRYGYGQR